jgi:hypothetical protein
MQTKSEVINAEVLLTAMNSIYQYLFLEVNGGWERRLQVHLGCEMPRWQPCGYDRQARSSVTIRVTYMLKY